MIEMDEVNIQIAGNPLFNQPQYGWGGPMDFVVSSGIPKDGLIAAIAEDEGCTPHPSHPLLTRRTFAEHVFMYAGDSNGAVVTFVLVTLLPTSRGSVKLASADINDTPLIDPKFLSTSVDHYVAREALKLQIKFAGSNAIAIGRDILDGEIGAPGFDSVLSVDSTDSDIDARLRAGIG